MLCMLAWWPYFISISLQDLESNFVYKLRFAAKQLSFAKKSQTLACKSQVYTSKDNSLFSITTTTPLCGAKPYFRKLSNYRNFPANVKITVTNSPTSYLDYTFSKCKYDFFINSPHYFLGAELETRFFFVQGNAYNTVWYQKSRGEYVSNSIFQLLVSQHRAKWPLELLGSQSALAVS